MKHIIIAVFILISLVCYSKTFPEARVGKVFLIKDGGINHYFVYCGMVSDKVFSVKSDDGRSSINLYYPVTVKIIKHGKFRFQVIDVYPDRLVLNRLR